MFGKYTIHPGFAMEAASIKNLPTTTGKTLEQWIEIVKECGPATLKERAAWLKNHHGIGTNTVTWIAERAEGKDRIRDGRMKNLLKRDVAQALLPAVSTLMWTRFFRGNRPLDARVGKSADTAGRSAQCH